VALAAAALVTIRRRARASAAFAAPGYPYVTIAFVCLLASVVVLLALSQPVQVLSSFAVVLLGVVVWRRFERRSLS